MKHFFFSFAFLLLTSCAFAQMDISFYGLRGFVPGTSFASGWGGGASFLSRPLSRTPAMKSLPVKMQLGGYYYAAGAGMKEFNGIDRNGNIAPGTDVTFSNMHLGIYAQSRFTMQNASSRRVPYLDLSAGLRYLNASQSIVSGNDTSGATLSRATRFSGGIGAGMLMNVTGPVWIDFGLQWQMMAPGGQFVNMASVKNTGDGISHSMKNAPAGLLLFRIGISFRTSSYSGNGCCDFPGCTIPSHHTPSCEVNAK